MSLNQSFDLIHFLCIIRCFFNFLSFIVIYHDSLIQGGGALVMLQDLRDRLKTRYETLYQSKREVLGKENEAYDKRALELIQDLLNHTKKHWDQESNCERKSNLNKIVRSTLLLSFEFKSRYNKQPKENINIWRHLEWLVVYQITEPHETLHQLLAIQPECINALFEELFGLVDSVLTHEIDNGEDLPEVRKKYRKPNQLPILEALSTHAREKIGISKMLDAIEFARNIDFSVATDYQVVTNKAAFLRQLQIIGEFSTSKNLSTSTKKLVLNIHWEHLSTLRNKLSHIEWDIHDQHIKNDLSINLLVKAQEELESLELAIEVLERTLNEKQELADLIEHYKPVEESNVIQNQCLLSETSKSLFMNFFKRKNLDQCDDLKRLLNSDIKNIKLIPEIIKRISGTKGLEDELRLLREALEEDKKNYGKAGHDSLQPKIQELSKVLNSDNDFKRIFKNKDTKLIFHKSCDTDNITRLIGEELDQLQKILGAVDDEKLLKKVEFFPEDVVFVEFDDRQVNELADQAGPQMAQIISYCWSVGCKIGIEIACRRDHVRIELIQAINIYGAKCKLYNSLLKNPEIIEAAFFFLARIENYLMLLAECDQANATKLPSRAEFKALRDFIHHDNPLFETLSIQPVELMARYASLFINDVKIVIDAINQVKQSPQTGQPSFYGAAKSATSPPEVTNAHAGHANDQSLKL